MSLYKMWTMVQEADWNVSVFDIHLWKLWIYCPGYARVKGNGEEGRLAGKAAFAGGLTVKSQKMWNVEELESIPADTKPRRAHDWWFCFGGWERAIRNQTNIETVLLAVLGKVVRHMMEHKMAFSISCIDTLLNWTELQSTAAKHTVFCMVRSLGFLWSKRGHSWWVIVSWIFKLCQWLGLPVSVSAWHILCLCMCGGVCGMCVECNMSVVWCVGCVCGV